MLYTAVQFCLYCELRREGNWLELPKEGGVMVVTFSHIFRRANHPNVLLHFRGVIRRPPFFTEPTILLSVSGTEKYLNQCYSRRFVLCVGDEKTRAPAKANSNGILTQHTPVSILYPACRGQYEPASMCRAHWTFRRPLIKGVLEYAIIKYRVPPCVWK
jgi:hypothetical protein